MIALSPNECRVLGVLIEKAQTTPGQYPMSLNALVNGANQKSNRFPVTNLTEEHVLAALDALRTKGLAREVMLSNDRVAKYRHLAREALETSTHQLAVLAELLLRGPQSVGDLRSRASRMSNIQSLDEAQAVLESLITREPPIVKRLPPPPGSRAPLYAQLLCPNLHPIHSATSHSDSRSAPSSMPSNDGAAHPDAPSNVSPEAVAEVLERMEALEDRIIRLERALSKFASSLSEPDPLL